MGKRRCGTQKKTKKQFAVEEKDSENVGNTDAAFREKKKKKANIFLVCLFLIMSCLLLRGHGARQRYGFHFSVLSEPHLLSVTPLT